MNPLLHTYIPEADVGAEAERLGLKHVGWGRYANKSGSVTHVSKDGKLVPIGSAGAQTFRDKHPPRRPNKISPSVIDKAKQSATSAAIDALKKPKGWDSGEERDKVKQSDADKEARRQQIAHQVHRQRRATQVIDLINDRIYNAASINKWYGKAVPVREFLRKTGLQPKHLATYDKLFRATGSQPWGVHIIDVMGDKVYVKDPQEE